MLVVLLGLLVEEVLVGVVAEVVELVVLAELVVLVVLMQLLRLVLVNNTGHSNIRIQKDNKHHYNKPYQPCNNNFHIYILFFYNKHHWHNHDQDHNNNRHNNIGLLHSMFYCRLVWCNTPSYFDNKYHHNT